MPGVRFPVLTVLFRDLLKGEYGLRQEDIKGHLKVRGQEVLNRLI
jgi:hypothetical protein